MSYIPNPRTPSTWQSDMQKPGPVRRATVSPVSSGSRRSYGNTWQPSVDFARAGGVLNNATGQYGNYLLYRDQVAMHNAHVKEQKGKELNKAAGTAIEAMLGGVNKTAKRGVAGNPTPPSIGSPHTKAAGAVGPASMPHQQGGGQLEMDFSKPLEPMEAQQLAFNFSRGPSQPTLAQGNTATPSGPQAVDPRIARRTNAQVARSRKAGMRPKGSYFDASPDTGDQDPWFNR